MDNKEFLEEALSCPTCPKDFEKIFMEFTRYQDDAIRTLDEFVRVCNLANIDYQLAFGSLLGAVRDKGQIPWDYDVDVLVHFEDRKKMISAFKAYLSKDYVISCGEEAKTEQYFTRIAPKEYNPDCLHVDVFYYAGLPSDLYDLQLHAKKMRELIVARDSKLSLPINVSKEYRRTMIKCYFKYLFVSYDEIMRRLDREFGKYNSRESKYCANCNSNFGTWFYQTEWINETMKINMRGNQYSIPVGYEKCLGTQYGDYSKYLPIEKRIKEVLVHHRSLMKHAKR